MQRVETAGTIQQSSLSHLVLFKLRPMTSASNNKKDQLTFKWSPNKSIKTGRLAAVLHKETKSPP